MSDDSGKGKDLEKFSGIFISSLIWILLVSCIATSCYSRSSQSQKPYWIDDQQVRESWTRDLPGRVVSAPVCSGDILLLRQKESVLALDANSGNIIWESLSKSDRFSKLEPIVIESIVIVPEKNGCLAAFSLQNGSNLWRSCQLEPEIESDVDSSSSWRPRQIPVMSLVFDKNQLYITRFNWDIAALEIKTGILKWSQPIPNRRFVTVLSCGKDICFDGTDSLVKLSPENGEVISELDLTGEIGPIASGENALVALADETRTSLYNINPEDFTLRWQADTLQSSLFDITDISIQEDFLVLLGQSVAVMDLTTGNLLWKLSDFTRAGDPAIHTDYLFVRDTMGLIYQLDLAQGFIIKSMDPKRHSSIALQEHAGLTVNDKFLFFITNARVAHAIEY